MTIDRRNPHKPFDPDLILSFLKSRKIVSAELLLTGKTNSNYKLLLNDDEIYVLRFYSNGDPAREDFIRKLVSDFVPVPSEIHRGEGWSVFNYLKGKLLANFPEYTDKAAEVIAKISSITFDSSGWINADGSITPFDFDDGKDFTKMMLENPEVQKWIGQEGIDAIYKFEETEKRCNDEVFGENHLVHGDFNPTNILINGGEVSGVLDWEWSHSGTPYMDIGNLLRNTEYSYHNKIKRGLKKGGMILPDDWIRRAEYIDLSSHLEFLTSNRSNDFKRKCVKWINNFISKYS